MFMLYDKETLNLVNPNYKNNNGNNVFKINNKSINFIKWIFKN